MRPGMSSVPLDDEPKQTSLQGSVTTYYEQPTTGVPAKGYYTPVQPPEPSSSAWHNDSSVNVPIAAFEQSAPNPYGGGSMNERPLPCVCGMQWTLFCCAWLIWPLWYVGAMVKCFRKDNFDPRERSGWIANCVMSAVFTVVWVSLLLMSALNGSYNYYNPECIPDPITGLCL